MAVFLSRSSVVVLALLCCSLQPACFPDLSLPEETKSASRGGGGGGGAAAHGGSGGSAGSEVDHNDAGEGGAGASGSGGTSGDSGSEGGGESGAAGASGAGSGGVTSGSGGAVTGGAGGAGTGGAGGAGIGGAGGAGIGGAGGMTSSCGNSKIETGETCDPPAMCSKREDCVSTSMCERAIYGGAPDTCNARCECTDPSLGCFAWRTIPNIGETATIPPPDAWQIGSETIIGEPTMTFVRYICRADGGEGLKIGKATFGYGCYLPGSTSASVHRVLGEVQVLAMTATTPCLDWQKPTGATAPVSAFMQNGTFICRAQHTGPAPDFNNATSTGEHVGQVVEQGGSLGCAFEFYGARLVEMTDFEILVRLSP